MPGEGYFKCGLFNPSLLNYEVAEFYLSSYILAVRRLACVPEVPCSNPDLDPLQRQIFRYSLLLD
jgi:hypothetical protein